MSIGLTQLISSSGTAAFIGTGAKTVSLGISGYSSLAVGDVVLAFIGLRETYFTPTTLSSSNISFGSIVASGTDFGSTVKVAAFVGTVTTANTGDTFVIGYNSNATGTGTAYVIVELVKLSGATSSPIAQYVSAYSTTSATITASFGTTPASTSATIAFALSSSSFATAAPTPESGYTTLASSSLSNYWLCEALGAPDSSPSVTCASSTIAAYSVLLALEIAALRSDTTKDLLPSISTSSGGTTSWTNQENATQTDGNFATATTDATASNNPYLVLTNFNFGLPTSASISNCSVTVNALYGGTGTPAIINSIQLQSGGTDYGSAITPGTAITTSNAPYTFSFGSASLTPTLVNDSSFGVKLNFASGTVAYDTYNNGNNGKTYTLGQSSSTYNWTIPNTSITGDTTNIASMSPDSTASNNAYLYATNFGFALPSDATVTSFWSYCWANYSGGTTGGVSFDTWQLYNGSLLGSSQSTSALTASNVQYTVDNGASYSWGASLTPSDVNSTNFGMAFRFVGTPSTTSSTLYARTAAQSSATNSWTNLTNATGSTPGTYASLVMPGASANVASNFAYLYLTNFGFSIPTNATITGLTVNIRRNVSGSTTGQVRDNTVQIWDGSSLIGSNLAATGTKWPTTIAAASYGGQTNLWGATLTPTLVNSSGFGLAVRIVGSTATTNRTANIDYLSARIYYTVPGDRNVVMNKIQTGVYYSQSTSSTVYVDSVTLKVSATGVVFPVATLSEAMGSSVVISNLRSLGAYFSEAESISSSISVEVAISSLIATISEAESISTALSKTTLASTSISESESTSAIIGRSKALQSTASELENLIQSFKKAIGITSSLSEAENTLILNSLRARKASASIGEAENVSTTLKKLQNLIVAIGEIQNYSASASRSAKLITAISEAELLALSLAKHVTMSASIPELDAITAVLAAFKTVTSALTEAEVIAGAFLKFKALASAITEISLVNASASRRQQLVSSVAELENFISTIARLRKNTSNIVELEVLTSILVRAKALVISIVQQELVSANLGKAILVNCSIDEQEQLSSIALKYKALIAAIAEAESHFGTSFKRTRGSSSSVSTAEGLVSALVRSGHLVSYIAESQTMESSAKRLRLAIGDLTYEETFAGIISKATTLVSDISELLGIDATIKLIVTDPSTILVSITWSQFEEDTPGILNEVQYTQSWSVKLKQDEVQIALPVGETIELSAALIDPILLPIDLINPVGVEL